MRVDIKDSKPSKNKERAWGRIDWKMGNGF